VVDEDPALVGNVEARQGAEERGLSAPLSPTIATEVPVST
jgi:hypothetical protein